MLGIARHPGHAHAEMTGDIAAAIPRVVGFNRRQHGQVRYECGHPDTVPKPERGNRRLTLPRQLPVQAGQRPAEDGTSPGLAGCPMANRAESAQCASRSAGVMVLADSPGGTPGLTITSVRLSRIAAYRRAGTDSPPWEHNVPLTWH
jgi:hypothetical protein